MDKRYQAIKERLSLLSNEELERIVDNIDKVLFDTYNYKDGKYCPLAIAMELDLTIDNPTQEKIATEIGERFFIVNILKGIKGDFYTNNRKEDLLYIINKILSKRKINLVS